LADANLYRFSSKEFHTTSGLHYYLYRYYDAGLQRWLNRDPIGEGGGVNLYAYVGNDATGSIDAVGLAEIGKDSAGTTVVTVEKCEIVLYIGHGNPKNDPSFIFPSSKGGCPSGA